jgi:hypothetical protein
MMVLVKINPMNHDEYHKSLTKEILRLERYVHRIQKRLSLLKETYKRTQGKSYQSSKIQQLDLFGT